MDCTQRKPAWGELDRTCGISSRENSRGMSSRENSRGMSSRENSRDAAPQIVVRHDPVWTKVDELEQRLEKLQIGHEDIEKVHNEGADDLKMRHGKHVQAMEDLIAKEITQLKRQVQEIFELTNKVVKELQQETRQVREEQKKQRQVVSRIEDEVEDLKGLWPDVASDRALSREGTLQDARNELDVSSLQPAGQAREPAPNLRAARAPDNMSQPHGDTSEVEAPSARAYGDAHSKDGAEKPDGIEAMQARETGGKVKTQNDSSRRVLPTSPAPDTADTRTSPVPTSTVPKSPTSPAPESTNISNPDLQTSYAFAESVWDAALFIGCKPLGHAGSCFMVILLILNVIMQLMYISIVFSNFTDSNFDGAVVEGFERLRFNLARDSNYVGQGGASLVARICAEDSSLEMGGRQIFDLSLINGYLPEHTAILGSDQLGSIAGPLMCTVSLMVWALVWGNEFRQVAHQQMAMNRLRENGKGHEFRCVHLDGTTLIEDIHQGSFLYFMFLALLRLVIATMLGIAGFLFIAHTIRIEDLLLNAIALNFVLHLHELCFAALAPIPVQAFLRSLKPVVLQHVCQRHGFDLVSCLSAFLVVLGFSITMPILLHEIAQLEEARDALCAGEIAFVTTTGILTTTTMTTKL